MGQRPSGFEYMYERWTLEGLVKECHERKLGANVQDTIVELHRIINGGLNQQLFAETVGIEGGLELLHSLLWVHFAIKIMLIPLQYVGQRNRAGQFTSSLYDKQCRHITSMDHVGEAPPRRH